jgi:serine/threonine-protein kinase
MRHLSPNLFRQADAIFDAALDLAPADRVPFVARACQGQDGLRRLVDRLLRADEIEHGVLDEAATTLAKGLRSATETNASVAGLRPSHPAEVDRIGPYQVRERLGAGGLGVVYLATRVDGNTLVAVKVLRDGAFIAGEPLRRFLMERQLIARLSHPHIARIVDRGITADGAPFFVMPHYPGGTLAARLASGPLALADALRLARQVAEALHAAHAEGVIHRDVKPANVLLDEHGDAQLADFSISRLHEPETHASTVVGTMAYVAPELLHGHPADARTDIWAFGVTLHELVTGSRPFVGVTHAALLHAIATLDPVRPVRTDTFVPPALQSLLQHLLQKDPAQRPQHMHEVIAALTAVQHDPTAPYAGAVPLRRGTTTDVPSVPVALLVLPFLNASDQADDEPWCVGMTNELITGFGGLRGVRVTARTTAFSLGSRAQSATELGMMLGVDYLLEGTVQRVHETLRVTVNLVRTRDGTIAWSAHYQRPLADRFVAQGELAQVIIDTLSPQLTASVAPIRRATPRSPRAHEAFLRGRFLWERRGPGDAQRALQYFEDAVAADPGYADAHAGIADALLLSVTFGGRSPMDVLPRVRASIAEALRLGPDSATVRATSANMLSAYEWQWEAAEAECRQAIDLDPAHSAAWLYLAIHLQHAGRTDEAIATARHALGSDPLSAPLQMTLGRAYMHAGQLAAALPPLRAAVELTPGSLYALRQLGDALLLAGSTEEALLMFQSAADIGGHAERGHLAYALARSGDVDRATLILQHLLERADFEYVSPFAIAMACAGLGRDDDAIRWLERGIEGRAAMMNTIAVTPVFASLRAHAQFPVLLRGIGLPRSTTSS